MSVSVTLNNLLTNGQILYIGQLLVTDSSIPNTQYGAFASSAIQVGNGFNATTAVPAINNTIFYFWSSTGTTPPADTQNFQGALMLNGSNGTINLINSSFGSIYGQSDNTQVWSIINSTIISLNNQAGYNMPVAYNNVPAGTSLNPSLYPYPYPNSTFQTVTNNTTLAINLAYHLAPANTVVKSNTIVALYTVSNTGGLPSYIGLFNNALGALVDIYTDNKLIVTRTSTNNYQVTAAAQPSSGLQWWAWLLIILGILIVLFLLVWGLWSMYGHQADHRHHKAKTYDSYADSYYDTRYSQQINPVMPPTNFPPPVSGSIVYPAGYVSN